jgi:hypothetical protein
MVEAGQRSASVMWRGRKSQGGDSMESLYGQGAVRVQGEVKVSAAGKLRRATGRNSMATDHSWDRTSREDSQHDDKRDISHVEEQSLGRFHLRIWKSRGK